MMRAAAILTALLAATQASAQIYTIQAQSAAYQPIVGGTSLVGGTPPAKFSTFADEEEIQVPLGFSFPYFGHMFTSVWVDSNGFLSFDPMGCMGSQDGTECYSGQGIPQVSRGIDYPHNIIAPWWDDFEFVPGQTDVVYTATAGQFDLE